jgi:hypothetical protein
MSPLVRHAPVLERTEYSPEHRNTSDSRGCGEDSAQFPTTTVVNKLLHVLPTVETALFEPPRQCIHFVHTAGRIDGPSRALDQPVNSTITHANCRHLPA